MIAYKLTGNPDSINKVENGISTTYFKEFNAIDWKAYQDWLSEGNEPEPQYTEAELLDRAKNEATARINTGYQNAVAALVATYPAHEIATFDKQEAEARNPDGPTPFIDAMLTERPLNRAELIARILAKADGFAVAVGALTGKRQKLEDDIKTAASVAEYELIQWEQS